MGNIVADSCGGVGNYAGREGGHLGGERREVVWPLVALTTDSHRAASYLLLWTCSTANHGRVARWVQYRMKPQYALQRRTV